MKYNKYKKLIYLLGLTSILTLNGCRNDKNPDVTEVTEITDTTKNNCNHLDEDTLEIKTLSDGSKYVTDANVFYSLRERFLNNNNLVSFKNLELNDSMYNELLNSNDYLYMYDNTQIRNHLIYYMNGLKNIYPELEMSEINGKIKFYEESDTDVDIRASYEFADNVRYSFNIDSNFADFESIDIDISNDVFKFSKYMHCMTLGDSTYDIIEQYGLSSVEKTDLNRITIGLMLRYKLNKDLILEQNYLCEDCEINITLNNGEDSLEIELSEDQFNQLANILTEAARNGITVEQFLEQNNELMIGMCVDEYSIFLEKTNAISYVKKPVY